MNWNTEFLTIILQGVPEEGSSLVGRRIFRLIEVRFFCLSQGKRLNDTREWIFYAYTNYLLLVV